LIERYGDLFTTKAVALGHGVNCRGIMGAGVAKTFKTNFPINYAEYRDHCHRKILMPGKTLMVAERDKQIYNMASQLSPGPDASYLWLFNAALSAARIARRHGLHSIAIPQIGCGIGGLQWERVSKLLEAIEIIVPAFDWEVWTYEG
jgi:O-acetyl-ADP-ribose deacetylase (regulator of RNase III)